MLYLAMKQEVRQFCSVRHETCTLVVQLFETNIVGDQVVQSLPGNAGCRTSSKMLCECVEFLRHRIWLLRPVRSQVWCLKINTRPPYGAILRARQHGCPPVVPHPESLAAQAAYTECSISLMDIVTAVS